MLCRKSSIKKGGGSEPVYLNVYDLTSFNGCAYWLGLGAFHSGVQVYGVEYSFGAHEYSTTGIFAAKPKQHDGFNFRKTILIGWTDVGPAGLRRTIRDLAEDYTGRAYNLVTRNCNHFCNDACIRLTGNPIPNWINRLARIGSFCNCLLPASLISTNIGIRHDEVEEKVHDVEMEKLRSSSTRFTSSSNSSSSSSLSPSGTVVRTGRGRSRTRRTHAPSPSP